MKIFIAGARSINLLDDCVVKRLQTICDRNYNILVGDCYGIDSAVQKFCAALPYERVTVFASNGKARNNIGGWDVENIPTDSGLVGFNFYRQKDIAMAKAADYGFMIWDGKSRGTYQNILTLLKMGKQVLVYIRPKGIMHWCKTTDDLKTIMF